MRLTSWIMPKPTQLDLLSADVASEAAASMHNGKAPAAPPAPDGRPLVLPVARLFEDPNNPRTEFAEAEIEELAEDIRQHGVLQPLVVHPADSQGRYGIHFGAKRWRAARRAGLIEVPVVLRDAPADPYAQVAENQKRHGLTPLDLARFIRARADAGDSNAAIAKRLGMDLTTVAHHLALLDLPPELSEALQSGRCASPRTLYELSKLHRKEPERARALLNGDEDITRGAINAVRTQSLPPANGSADRCARSSPLLQANAACERLERALDRLAKADPHVETTDLERLKRRVANLASRLA